MENQKKRLSLGAFSKQVRAEARKITWPTKQATISASIMIIVISLIAAFFFFAVDQVIMWVFKTIYNLVG